MMTAVRDDVQGLVHAVDAAPEVEQGQRAAVHGLAGELLEQVSQTDGLDLAAFAAAGVRLSGSCARPETPARSCTCDDSAWFDEVGIRERERLDELRESEHFARVDQVGASIGECGEAIGAIVASAESAVRAVLEPARRMLDVVLNCGVAQLVRPAVEMVIEALRTARETASDRNGVIRECLGEVASRVDAAASVQPAPPVDFGGAGRALRDVVTQTASAAAEAKVGGVRVAPVLMVGALGAVGVVAAMGALEFITAAGQESEPAPAPQPEPEPAPASVPEPVPAPVPQSPVGDGVIAPPPELSQVEQPDPPPKKLDSAGTYPAQTAGTGGSATGAASAGPAAAPGNDPWAVKKTGEW